MSQSQYSAAINHHRAGQLAEAEALYRQVLAQQPRHADARHMLGLLYYQTNRAESAAASIAEALAITPKNADYLNHYGLALRALNQHDAAIRSLQQAVLLQPKDLDFQLNLGNTLLAADRFEEAAGYYRRVLRVMPRRDDVRAALCHCLATLGNQAQSLGNFMQAEACFQEALQFNTQDAAIFYNLGNAQRELGKAAEAEKSYRTAIGLAPDDADAYNNLGNIQREIGQLDLAIESYRKALALDPQLYHAKVHLVHQKQHICDWQGLDDEIAEIRQWVRTRPVAQISPFAFLAMPGTSAEEQLLCASNWVNNRYAGLFEYHRQHRFNDLAASSEKRRAERKKIRIGYLSADFRLHPLAFLVSELFELHDKSQFEIIAFSFGVNDKSDARKRLEKACDEFHDIRQLSEIQAAQKIHAAGIDILVDLTGFTQTSRSGIAAMRPAAIHINWLGFPGTMGEFGGEFGGKPEGKPGSTPLFDYILTDNFITPPGSAGCYAEQLLPLPDSYQPNDRKRPVGALPAREACQLPENAFVFCCFNQSFKITADIFAIWMRLLQARPDSVLWLLDCNPWARQNLVREAAAQGIAASRLIFAPRVPIADHLARHVHADLFLDTLPYNAHTTCSDALWMGLPVLTCVGGTFASRVAGSLVSAAGASELLAYTLQDYENKALELSNNPEKLAAIRQKLLADKAASPLFDTLHFSHALEETYRTVWQRYLAAPANAAGAENGAGA